MAKMQLENYFKAVDGISKPMKKMSKSVTGFSKKTQKSFKGMNAGIGKMRGMMRGLVAVLATGAIVKAIGGFASKGDEIAKTARQIGLTAEALQELRFAAERQGISTEDFTKALQKMNKNVGEARVGTGSLTTYLNKANPALGKQLKLVENSEQAFDLLIEEINRLPNQMEKAALANAAFGKSGQKILIMAENGVAGIAALREEAKKYGDIISDDAAAASEKFVDSLTNLKAAMNGIRNSVLGPLIDAIQPVLQSIADWAAANRELIAGKINKFISAIIPVFQSLGKILPEIWPVILQIADAFTELLPLLQPLISMLGDAFIDLLRSCLPFIKTFIGLLTDLMPPILSLASSLLPPLLGILKPVLKMVESMLPIFEMFAEILTAVLVPAIEVLSAVLSPLLDFFGEMHKSLAKLLIPAFEKISSIINPISGVLGKIFGKKTSIDINENSGIAGGDQTPMSSNSGLIRSITESRRYEEHRSTVGIEIDRIPDGFTARAFPKGTAPPINVPLGPAGLTGMGY